MNKITLNWYLQHIANDAYAPHVSGEANLVIVDHFRGDELWRTKQYAHTFPLLVVPETLKLAVILPATYS